MWYLQDRCYISKLTPAAKNDKQSMFNKVSIHEPCSSIGIHVSGLTVA